ncbi:MAG: EAL domain-containing protein [Actinobacteria bacterium]|nr:EAL domain-containing protein [Actinomycetota bacterium]
MSRRIRQFDAAWHVSVPRGLRSLSGRLVMLLLVPLIAAQALTVISLNDRHTAANEARDLTRSIDLMAIVGSMYTPLALETAASMGLAEVDRMGVPRSVVTEVTGFDYGPYVTESRVTIDAALDHLVMDHAEVVLPDGRRLVDAIAGVRVELDRQRAVLDAGTAVAGDLAAAFFAVDDLVRSLADVASEVHDHVTIDPGLGDLADEVAHLLTLVEAVATDTKYTSLVLGASDRSFDIEDALLAAGATDFVIDHYAAGVEGDEATAWGGVMATVDAYLALRPALVGVLEIRSAAPETGGASKLLTDPAFIRTIATVLVSSFGRLEAVGAFTEDHFDRSKVEAERIASASDDEVRAWTGILIVLTMASVGLLILTVTSTVRPLRRLTTRALQLGRGIVDPEPLELSGPSDVRAVTATFNNVTSVLSTFEHQVRRMSAGDDLPPSAGDELPGRLGQAVRAQIEHLADMTARLRESEALARAIIETAADAIWTVDARGRILSANGAAERLLGIDAAAQLGRSLLRLQGRQGSLADFAGEVELQRHDGTTVDVLISHSEVPAEPEPIHAVFARDISDRKRFEQQLAHQARHDGLTGLPNRLAALEHIDLVTRRAELHASTVTVLFVDLDGFKSVNDSRGHASGDHLLHEVGLRLTRTLRSSEFVARLGGDEFLVVCEGLGLEAAEALGERIIREIAQPYVQGDDLFTISASVGVAIARGDEHIDGLELVREADVAVYHAKERGRSRVVVFDETLQEAVEATAEIELALRQAIGDGELVLHYQPVLDLAAGMPWGVEALVRWNRPGHGLLGPDRFIPVAERSSLVIDLGRWVLLEGCRTLAGWQDDPARRHLRIAVNVSGRHLVEGNLLADIDEVLAETGADPSGLEIELTETHLLADFERANLVLTELRHRGISVAVDDFGTGYSSMGYLRQLEIDALKIDKMFVARVTDVGYDRTIVEVLVQLGLTLGLDIVAEGVETAEQLEFVRTHRCTRAQGFHIARPMPGADLDRWLQAHGPRSQRIGQPAGTAVS